MIKVEKEEERRAGQTLLKVHVTCCLSRPRYVTLHTQPASVHVAIYVCVCVLVCVLMPVHFYVCGLMCAINKTSLWL